MKSPRDRIQFIKHKRDKSAKGNEIKIQKYNESSQSAIKAWGYTAIKRKNTNNIHTHT